MKMSTLIYIRKNGKTLMLLRNKKKNDIHQGKWNGLGGKLEAMESPEECAIRETYEESGLVVKSLEFAGMLTFPNFADGIDWFVFTYTCDDFEGELMDNPPEGELHWIDDDKVLDLNLWDGDRLFLKWIMERRFFSAKFFYEDKKMSSHSVVFYENYLK